MHLVCIALYFNSCITESHISKKDTHWKQAVPSRVRVIAYLLYVCQGMKYLQISEKFGIGVMTAYKCIHACTYAIYRHMFSTYIRLPTPAEVTSGTLIFAYLRNRTILIVCRSTIGDYWRL